MAELTEARNKQNVSYRRTHYLIDVSFFTQELYIHVAIPNSCKRVVHVSSSWELSL
jgi:hypothetical protein